MFKKTEFSKGDILPDGTEPYLLIRKWSPFIEDCIMLLDGDGTFRHWKYEGAYACQPWIDIQFYKAIRGKWVELKNKEIEANTPKFGNKAKAFRKPSLRRKGKIKWR